MRIKLEAARPEDAKAMLVVHRSAIRGEPAAFYSPDIIEAWAPLPVQLENIEGLERRITDGQEEAVVARDSKSGQVVAFGSIVPAVEELRAIYVAPDYSRLGIGSMILKELEVRARKHGLTKLSMDASLNAESFYRRHGFESEGAGEHELYSGRQMPCVRMRKFLDRQTQIMPDV